MVCYRLGSRSSEPAFVTAPARRLGGGGTPGYWQYDRKPESAASVVALVLRQYPPPAVEENNFNTTIQRISNKT